MATPTRIHKETRVKVLLEIRLLCSSQNVCRFDSQRSFFSLSFRIVLESLNRKIENTFFHFSRNRPEIIRERGNECILKYFNLFSNPFGIYLNSFSDHQQELFFISTSGSISYINWGRGGEGRGGGGRRVELDRNEEENTWKVVSVSSSM